MVSAMIIPCDCGSRIATPSGTGGFQVTCGDCGKQHWVPPPEGGVPPASKPRPRFDHGIANTEPGVPPGIILGAVLAVVGIAIAIGWWVTHR